MRQVRRWAYGVRRWAYGVIRWAYGVFEVWNLSVAQQLRPGLVTVGEACDTRHVSLARLTISIQVFRELDPIEFDQLPDFFKMLLI